MKTFCFYFVQKDVTWFEQSVVGGPFNKRLVKTAQSGHIEKKGLHFKSAEGFGQFISDEPDNTLCIVYYIDVSRSQECLFILIAVLPTVVFLLPVLKWLLLSFSIDQGNIFNFQGQ